jgi:hypothetical protein
LDEFVNGLVLCGAAGIADFGFIDYYIVAG